MTAAPSIPAAISARPCPLCADDAPVPYLTTSDTTFNFPGHFQIVQCRACKMIYTNPTIDPALISAYYPTDYAAHADERHKKHHRPGRDIWDRLPPIGQRRLLDIGCGSGAYLARCKAAGWSVVGIEPNPRAAEAARSLGLEILNGEIPHPDLNNRRFDIITLLGVLDHIPDPLNVLREIRSLLDPPGLLIITVPNAASAAAQTFGPLWPGWDLPRHLNHFTAETISAFLQNAGFTSVELQWKRRPARWRRAVRLMRADSPQLRWKLLAASRDLCGLYCRLSSRGPRSDEIIAIAKAPE